MGIKEDAEAAYAKTVEAKEAKDKTAAEELEVKRAATEVAARQQTEQWAERFGYAGQAVITNVTFPQRSGSAGSFISVDVEFKFDELEFTGRSINQSFTVQLKDSTQSDIRTLEQLGEAIKEAERERERRGRWQ